MKFTSALSDLSPKWLLGACSLLALLTLLITITPAVATEQRPVYIISDHINNNQVDNARINTIIKSLKESGLEEVYNAGVGTNNYAILRNTPNNAVIIQIMGGTCAATIYSMVNERYYLNLKGDRIVYPVWVYPSIDISQITYLPRSGDDGGHGSFTGVSNPAEQLEQAGYNWTYWREAEDLEKITNEVSNSAGIQYKEPDSGVSGKRTKNKSQNDKLANIYTLFLSTGVYISTTWIFFK